MKEKIGLLSEKDKDYLRGYIDRAILGIKEKPPDKTAWKEGKVWVKKLKLN